MKVINSIVEGDYTTDIYDNGMAEKYLTNSPPKILQPPVLTETQEVAYQTATNMEMLLALAELEGGLA